MNAPLPPDAQQGVDRSPLHVDRRNPGASALPLSLLHGWGMNLAVFDALRDALPDVESWAIDLPGHGRSAWRAEHVHFDAQLDALLESLPARSVLMGWSLGGEFAMEIARRHPARVAALVLVSSTPRFARGDDWPHGMGANELATFRGLVEREWRQTLGDFVWLQLRGSRNAEATQQRVAAALDTHGAPDPAALGGLCLTVVRPVGPGYPLAATWEFVHRTTSMRPSTRRGMLRAPPRSIPKALGSSRSSPKT